MLNSIVRKIILILFLFLSTSFSDETILFVYTGSEQTFIVPEGAIYSCGGGIDSLCANAAPSK